MKIIWLQGASCSGCSMNFISAKRPNIIELEKRYNLEILFHPSLSPLSGRDVQNLLSKYKSKPIDILAIEGGILTGPEGTGNYHHFAGAPFMKWVQELSKNANYLLALGSCSSYGGIPSISPNFGDVEGLQFLHKKPGGFLGKDYRSGSGLPVINVPGCPTHWMNAITVLIDICMNRVTSDLLDEYNRPKHIFKDYPHHGCPRNEYFEYRQESDRIGEPGCMFEYLGCHGPLVKCNANTHRWFDGWGSCTWAGFPCLGCVSPEFPEESFPMFETKKLAGIPIRLPDGVKKSAYLQAKIMGQHACPDRLRVRRVDSSE